MSVFVHAHGIKFVHSGQNSVNVVVEWPLKQVHFIQQTMIQSFECFQAVLTMR